ncbi:MFS transporter [Paracoccaceae bacterium]|jgi:predicted MFS family arabinose efflux permease|nr:MFS transporter [Paracoccaceae bacterium]|tara:strand:+ start:80 stop:1294 length:1215 start_codon:yes stop_codon:yes gene_type:complete
MSGISQEKRNVIVLVMAQAFLGAQLPMMFIIGGLAGQSLTNNICWATLPISFIVFGAMTTAPWLSQVMQNYGRRIGFLIGALAGVIGATICAIGMYKGIFSILLIGSYLTGIYQSSLGFYRFAATDTASDSFKAKAISYTMAGGLLSAIIGPQLVKVTSDFYTTPFLGVYVTVILINIIGAFLFLFLDIPVPKRIKATEKPSRTRFQILKTPRILISIIIAMVSYALMTLVMTSTPLAVVGCGYSQNNAADVVSAHVVAMFLPSFFTGHLINRFGVTKIISIGLVLLTTAGLVNLSGMALGNFFVGLILIGVGWNFGFIGATTMLATSHSPSERGKVQGLNDLFVYGFVTFASIASGALMNCSGATTTDGWNSVNLAMIPFIILAGISLFWLSKNKDANIYSTT